MGQGKEIMVSSWNTGAAAERFRAKNKSEPPANKKLIKKLHDAWARANGYKPQAASSFRMVLTNKRKYMRKAPSSKRLEKDTIK